jgi:hypothetical protein
MSLKMKAIQVRHTTSGNYVEVVLTGKLTAEDYEDFMPELERLFQEKKKIRMLVELVDFDGWTAGALWEDTKFAFRHFSDIERLAIVGDEKWEKGMAIFCKPFTRAEVRFFEAEKLHEARDWVTG